MDKNRREILNCSRLRRLRRKRRGFTVWLTGLSGAGKTTIAFALEELLLKQGYYTYALDGDNVRAGLNVDLDFSAADSNENIRRASELAVLFSDAGAATVCSFISPMAAGRSWARQRHVQRGLPFLEVHVDAPLDLCKRRDPKGLYMLAERENFGDFCKEDYQQPDHPDLVLKTAELNVQSCLDKVVELLSNHGLISTNQKTATE
jgi:adenylyl-sulfate kinase